MFSKASDGRVVGRTDQGCTWKFKVDSDAMELDPAAQSRLNQYSGLTYTITRWSVTVSGRHESEIIEARSHRPTVDYDFVLANGRRTKAPEKSGPGARKFLGTWAYDAADPQSRVNIRVSRYQRPYGDEQVVESPQRGLVTFTRRRDHKIAAQTDDGCVWMLAVRGNTALLDPAIQTCTLPQSNVTLKFWSIASDGTNQTSFVTGIDERGGSFVLSIGSLSKQ
ncbi:hypothetical protein [Actinopolymorpha pittospori]|uniref:Uncharacterized protein n=1 Tax=Actinopolymorpha pittospori TaxID=648752 RepID=A0A927RHU6_9ACTN|nr:hypothetical protein [Actinopolymorpha pittospori]MBE1603858.1 hypothetical protein [Actinopolymorpha pittospori]